MDWEVWLAILSTLWAVGMTWRAGKYAKYFAAALEWARVAASAIEEVDAASQRGQSEKSKSSIKREVGDHVTKRETARTGSYIRELVEIDSELHACVDAKEADTRTKGGMRVRRWFRRFLRGENLTGAAARIAGQAVIQKYLSDNRDD